MRDKDAIIGSMLICEMAAYYRAKGSSIKEELERIYAEYGRYLNKVDSFEFPGLSGMDKMADIMQNLRDNPPKDFAGDKVVKVVDYKKPEETGLPAANVLIYTLESGATRGGAPLRHRAEDQDLLHHQGQRPGRGRSPERKAGPKPASRCWRKS